MHLFDEIHRVIPETEFEFLAFDFGLAVELLLGGSESPLALRGRSGKGESGGLGRSRDGRKADWRQRVGGQGKLL